MHNSFFYIIIIGCILSIYTQSIISLKIDQTIGMINENMIQSCISQESLLKFYEEGVSALELDTNKVIFKVSNTVNDNLPFVKNKIGYYFYDSLTDNKQSCKIDDNKCNSVQIKIELFYKNEKAIRELRYELIKEN